MLRLAAYARVSTVEQDTNAFQLEECRKFIRAEGVQVAEFSDKISSYTPDRPGFDALLAMARRREIDGVVVYRLARFGRDPAQSIPTAIEWERMGIRIFSCTEPTDSPLVRDLLFLLANNDSRDKSVYVRLGKRGHSADGFWMTSAPAGYVIEKVQDGAKLRSKLAIDPAKAPKVRRLFELAATGRYSVRALRDEALTLDLRTNRGHVMGLSQLSWLLANEAYMGDVVYGKKTGGVFQERGEAEPSDWIVVRDAHPAIVDRETFAAVRAVFARHKAFVAGIRGSSFLLTGLLHCGLCGGRMYGANRTAAHVYHCSQGRDYGNCATKSVGGAPVDNVVMDAIRAIVITPEVRAKAEAIVLEREAERLRDANQQRGNLMASRRRIEDERLNLARKLMGEQGAAIAPDMYRQLEGEKSEALRIIDRALESLTEAAALDISALLAVLETMRWDDLDDEGWREAVQLLVEGVSVTKSEKRGQPVVSVSWTAAVEVLQTAILQSVQ